MKIINALANFGPKLSEQQVRSFLEHSKLNLQIATIDSNGDPNIHPVWYLYENEKLYVVTPRESKKAQNISSHNLIYFSIDDETMPYKGVKGKGTAHLLGDIQTNLKIGEKIILKYIGNLDSDIGKFIIQQIKNGNEIILEITPKFFSAWSFGN